MFLREMLEGCSWARGEKPDPAPEPPLPPGVAGVVAATVAAVTRAVRAGDGRRLRGPATAAPLRADLARIHASKYMPGVARALAEDRLGQQPFVVFLALKNEISSSKNTLVGAVTCIGKCHPTSYTVI